MVTPWYFITVYEKKTTGLQIFAKSFLIVLIIESFVCLGVLIYIFMHIIILNKKMYKEGPFKKKVNVIF